MTCMDGDNQAQKIKALESKICDLLFKVEILELAMKRIINAQEKMGGCNVLPIAIKALTEIEDM